MKELLSKSFIRIEQFNPEVELREVAVLYAQVFAGPPWNEFTKCGNCSEFYGSQTKPGDPCEGCGSNLVLAYPEEETKDYIAGEMKKPGSFCCLAKKGDEIIGFAWGYTDQSPTELANQKYKTVEMQQKIKSLLEKGGFNGEFFYFSECGVYDDERGQGISNLLASALLQKAKTLGIPITMRTNWQSPMMAVAKKFV